MEVFLNAPYAFLWDAMIYDSALDLIGNTPMVRITTLLPRSDVSLYIKLEKVNPGGSIKDRICKHMIEHAEREGLLKPGMTVIEPTSGNTGIGLALVCAVKGYKCELVMPETMTIERRKILLMYGAKVILSDGQKGMNGAQDLASKIVEENPGKYFMPNQFMNDYNVLAHYDTTAREIWDDTEGTLTHFVAGIGTTGTLMGTSRHLKEWNPSIEVVAVEPMRDTPIPGLKNLEVSYVPEIYQSHRIDRKITVSLEQAEDAARLLALREGLFCGPSSGAILHGALEVASSIREGTIVAMMPDGGEKYLSTTLCDKACCLQCICKHNVPCSLVEEIGQCPRQL